MHTTVLRCKEAALVNCNGTLSVPMLRTAANCLCCPAQGACLPAFLALTRHQVDRMVSATLAAVDAGLAAYGPRLVMFSSFDPEVCVEVKRRWVGMQQG